MTIFLCGFMGCGKTTVGQILAKKLGISARQLSYVKQSGAGEGLLLYGDTILPFVDRFPQNTELYRLMTTRLNETAGQEEENG